MVLLCTPDLTADHLKNVATAMNIMRLTEDSTDVQLEVEGHQFPAHRLILCAASSYFRAMFNNNSKEATAGKVQLHGVSLSTLKIVLHYIYTGVLTMDDNVECLKSVLCVAHMLRLESLCNHCFQLLCRDEMSKECFTDVWNLAEQYDSTATITDLLARYVQRHFSDMAGNPQFLQLTKDQLKSVLCTPCLNNCSTDCIVRTILSWADHKAKERGNDLLELLESLHLHCLSSEYLEKLQEHELIRENVNLLALLLKASTKQLQILGMKTNALSIVRFGEDENGESCASVYVHGNQRWMKKLLPFNLTLAMAVTYYKEHFYFIGGGNTFAECSNVVLKYCLDNNKVQNVASLAKNKLNVGSAVLGDHLFVIGGVTNTGTLSDVERYSDTSDTWQPVSPTNSPHNFPRVVRSLDHLLVVGSKTCSVVELYEEAVNQWTRLSSLPLVAKLHWPRVSVFQNKVYSLHENNVLYVYSVFKNEWESVTLPHELPPCCGLWNNADQSLPFLVVADSNNFLRKFDPSKKHLDDLCEICDGLQWNWWQVGVISLWK